MKQSRLRFIRTIGATRSRHHVESSYLKSVVGLSLNREQNDKPEQPISQGSSASSRHLLSSLSKLDERHVASNCGQADSQSAWKARQHKLWQEGFTALVQHASLPASNGKRGDLDESDFKRQLQKGTCGNTGLQLSVSASMIS